MPRSTKAESDERKAKIISLAKEGNTKSEIARLLGLQKQYVGQVISRAVEEGQIELEPAVDVKPIIEDIEALSGLTTAKLATLIDVSRETIWRWRSRKVYASAAYARRLKILLDALQKAAQ